MFTTASHIFTLLPTYVGICTFKLQWSLGICTFKLQWSLEQYGFELHGSTCMWIVFNILLNIMRRFLTAVSITISTPFSGINCIYSLTAGFMVYLWKIPKLYSLLSDSAYQICCEKKSLLNSLSGNLEIKSILGK